MVLKVSSVANEKNISTFTVKLGELGRNRKWRGSERKVWSCGETRHSTLTGLDIRLSSHFLNTSDIFGVCSKMLNGSIQPDPVCVLPVNSGVYLLVDSAGS